MPKLLLASLSLLLAFAILTQCKKEPKSTAKPPYFPNTTLPADTSKSVFADYAWQLFMSLNQPESGTKIPDSNKYRTRWSSFATSHNLFGGGDGANKNPTSDLKNEQSLVIPNYIQASDSSDWHQNSPLIDLENNYAWAGLRYNEVFTNYVLANGLNNLAAVKEAFHKGTGIAGKAIQWLKGKHTFPNLPAPVFVAKFEFPDYSIMLKPGWKILAERDQANDFFLASPVPKLIYENQNYKLLKNALAVRGLVDSECQLKPEVKLIDEDQRDVYNATPTPIQIDTFETGSAEFGLVGFHLTFKVPNHPFWVWATFEQISNGPMEGDTSAYAQHWTFFDDADNSKPHNAWPERTSGIQDSIPGLVPGSTNPNQLYKFQWFTPNVENQTPTQVTQINKIDPAVEAKNKEYRQTYANTIWSNYKLIDVQWKRVEQGIDKAYPPFVANAALETYVQATSSCMGCHALVDDVNRDKTDSTEYLLTSPTLYHYVIPMLASEDSVLVGDFSYGFAELVGLDITSRQVGPKEPRDSIPLPPACQGK